MFKAGDTVYLKKERYIEATVMGVDYQHSSGAKVFVTHKKSNGAIGIVNKWVSVEDVSKRKGDDND